MHAKWTQRLGKSLRNRRELRIHIRGFVLSATETSETEKRLQVTPREIFLGDSASQLTVTTNQGACLPDIQPGDQWLFYLQRDDKTNELLLEYGSPSEPMADAQKSIVRLRRLAQMTDSGIVAGYVTRGVLDDNDESVEHVPVPNHKLVAKRLSDGTEYAALSDRDGNYEFEPLPSGSYDLSANTTQGFWAEEGPTTVHAGGCTAFGIELHLDGGISGHVRSPDGKPFNIHPWVEIASEDGAESHSFYADEHGSFEARGLEPGRYLVGIGIAAQPDTPEWRSRVYYPGVRTKEEATVVEIGKAEKRTNIDFLLPNSVSH